METPVYSRTNKRDGLSVAVIRVDDTYRVTVRETVGDLILVSRDFDDREAAIEYARWFVA